MSIVVFLQLAIIVSHTARRVHRAISRLGTSLYYL